MDLNHTFTNKCLELLEEYRRRGMIVFNQGVNHPFREFDALRMAAIPDLRALLDAFLRSEIGLDTFRQRHEILCRKYDYWGMKSFNGQGFLNRIVKWAPSQDALSTLLRDVLTVPDSREAARKKIDFFHRELPRVVPRKGLPLRSAPVLLTYFWQIQNPEGIPLYYATSRQLLADNQLLDESKSPGELYDLYWQLTDAIADLFRGKIDLTGANVYWLVIHVLWIEHRQLILGDVAEPISTPSPALRMAGSPPHEQYLPPAISDLTNLARTDNGLAFERKVALFFKMLGFSVEQLGQGHGREPDGIARQNEHRFAVVFDAKASAAGYSIGTDDRALIEYLNKYEPRLRKEGFRSQYFIVLASDFKGNLAEPIARIRRETAVKAVVLLTANQALRILARLIEEPATFDYEALEHLLLESGPLSNEKIEEFVSS